jgi:uncharacterized protein (TIGR02001 family)
VISRRSIRLLLDAAGGLVLLMGSAGAWADDSRWSANVAVTTDYVLRGVSQSYGGAALQAGVSYQHPTGWFAGAWASNADPYPFYSNVAEVNVYAGYAWTLTRDFSARASYTRYVYAFDSRPRPYGYGEFSVTVDYRDVLAATVSYDPDTIRYATLGYRSGRPSAAYELNARVPLPRNLSLTGSVGYYDLTHLYGVGYWSATTGLSWSRGRLALDVTRFYSDPTVERLFDEASVNGRWVASASWRF